MTCKGVACKATGDTLVTADASQVSPRDFAQSLGLRILTPEQKAAEWRATCERYADAIERGNEWVVPPPCLRDAQAIVEERRADRDNERAIRFLMNRRVA